MKDSEPRGQPRIAEGLRKLTHYTRSKISHACKSPHYLHVGFCYVAMESLQIEACNRGPDLRGGKLFSGSTQNSKK